MEHIERKVDSLESQFNSLTIEMRHSTRASEKQTEQLAKQNEILSEVVSKLDVGDEKFKNMQKNIDRVESIQDKQGETIKEVRDGQRKNSWYVGLGVSIVSVVVTVAVVYIRSLF